MRKVAMSESDFARAKLLPDGTVVEVLPDRSTRPMEDHTDWERVLAMTEEEIEANALADPVSWRFLAHIANATGTQ